MWPKGITPKLQIWGNCTENQKFQKRNSTDSFNIFSHQQRIQSSRECKQGSVSWCVTTLTRHQTLLFPQHPHHPHDIIVIGFNLGKVFRRGHSHFLRNSAEFRILDFSSSSSCTIWASSAHWRFNTLWTSVPCRTYASSNSSFKNRSSSTYVCRCKDNNAILMQRQ